MCRVQGFRKADGWRERRRPATGLRESPDFLPAGLLALGSSGPSRLPASIRQWHRARAVPDYSGGPATAFDRFPFCSGDVPDRKDRARLAEGRPNREALAAPDNFNPAPSRDPRRQSRDARAGSQERAAKSRHDFRKCPERTQRSAPVGRCLALTTHRFRIRPFAASEAGSMSRREAAAAMISSSVPSRKSRSAGR